MNDASDDDDADDASGGNGGERGETVLVVTPPRLVPTGEAARELGVDRTTLARWADAGLVQPASRTMGGHLRWDLEDLRRQIAEAQRGGRGADEGPPFAPELTSDRPPHLDGD